MSWSSGGSCHYHFHLLRGRSRIQASGTRLLPAPLPAVPTPGPCSPSAQDQPPVCGSSDCCSLETLLRLPFDCQAPLLSSLLSAHAHLWRCNPSQDSQTPPSPRVPGGGGSSTQRRRPSRSPGTSQAECLYRLPPGDSSPGAFEVYSMLPSFSYIRSGETTSTKI